MRNFIQKSLLVLLGFTIGGGLLVSADYAFAFPPSTVAQGGTGVTAIATGSIPFGQGTTLGNSLTIGTSTNLSFSSTTNTLTIIGTATTSHIIDSELGSSGTNCVQASAAGALSVTGSACATALSGGTVPNLAYWTSASTLGSVSTSTLTAGTGLTGSFTQIGSGGTIALSTPVSIANGGTNATSLTTSGNSIYYDGTRLATALTTTKVTTPFASSTALSTTGAVYLATSNGYLNIGTTTPTITQGLVSSSTVLVPEYTPATSTSQTIDWSASNSQRISIGTSAVTVSFTNTKPGTKLTLIVANPASGTAGTITWPATVRWAGGTAPTQTTTSGHFDVWSFIDTLGTSTEVQGGAMSANF